MGVVYNEGILSEEMAEHSSSIYVPGNQIMTVSQFVKEVGDLRRAYKNPRLWKNGYGGMLPVVRLKRCSAKLIEEKTKRAVPVPSITSIEPSIKNIDMGPKFQKNGVIETSEEEDADDPEPTPDENPPETARSPEASDDPIGDLSSEEESDDSLPDITDPTYYGGTSRMQIKKKKKLSPFGKAKEHKFKNKKKHGPLLKSSGGALMKAARQTCFEKQKMFAISDKDKRLSKASAEADKAPLPPVELPPTHTPQPYKQTGFVHLKPNAKSPKDVERSNEKSSKKRKMSKEFFEADTQLERERMRQVLQKRLQSPPLQGEANVSRAPKSDEDEEHGDQNDGYNSDETIAYKEDVRQRNAEVLTEALSPLLTDTTKRKNPHDSQGIKKVTGSEGFSGPYIVGSPVSGADLDPSSHVMENSSDIMEGEHHIVIGDVQGGVSEAFENSPPPFSAPIYQQLDQKYTQKESLKNQINAVKEDMDKKLLGLKLTYEKVVTEVKSKTSKKVSIMEQQLQKVDEEIKEMVFQLTRASGRPEENPPGNVANDSRVPEVVPTEPVRDPLAVGQDPDIQEVFVKTNPEMKFNVISAASISKFGASHHVVPSTSGPSSPSKKIKLKRPSSMGSSQSHPVEGNTSARNDQFVPPNAVVASGRPIPVVTIANSNPSTQQQQLPQNVILPHQSTGSLRPPVLPLFQNVQGLPENQQQVLQALLPVSMAGSSGSQTAQLIIQAPQQFQGQNPGSFIITAPPGVPFNTGAGTAIINNPGTSVINNPVPSVINKPGSSVINKPGPSVINKPGPSVINKPGPSVINKPGPSVINKPGPVNTVVNNPRMPKTTNSTPQVSRNTVVPPTYPVTSTVQAPNAPQTVRRPPPRPQKPHLMVKPPPSASSVLGTQAKMQPTNTPLLPTVLPVPPHPATSAPTNVALPNATVQVPITPRPATSAPSNVAPPNIVIQVPSVISIDEESVASPEAEQSCFLCGSPGEFVCCNSIVYCSRDCKSKDWSRHSGECSRNSSS